MAKASDKPRAETRMAAAEAGRVRYLGPKCKRCSGRVRYTSSGGCVACNVVRASAYWRKLRQTLREAKS